MYDSIYINYNKTNRSRVKYLISYFLFRDEYGQIREPEPRQQTEVGIELSKTVLWVQKDKLFSRYY